VAQPSGHLPRSGGKVRLRGHRTTGQTGKVEKLATSITTQLYRPPRQRLKTCESFEDDFEIFHVIFLGSEVMIFNFVLQTISGGKHSVVRKGDTILIPDCCFCAMLKDVLYDLFASDSLLCVCTLSCPVRIHVVSFSPVERFTLEERMRHRDNQACWHLGRISVTSCLNKLSVAE